MPAPRKPYKSDLQKVCSDLGITVMYAGDKKTDTSAQFKCSCGVTYTRSPQRQIYEGRPCPECSKKLMHERQSQAALGRAAPNRISEDEFEKRLKRSGQPSVRVGKYTSIGKPTEFKCLECGNVQVRAPSDVLKFGCRQCSGHAKKDLDSYNQELNLKNIPFKATEYKGSRSPVIHTCKKCDFEVRAAPTNMLKKNKIGCANCEATGVYGLTVQGKHFRVRGFERYVLEPLVNQFGLDQVYTDLGGGVPKVKLNSSVHKPDFFIRNENLLVEVKSLMTAGLLDFTYTGSPTKTFNLLKRKRQAAVREGFRYVLILVSHEGKQIQIPKNWYSLNRSDIRRLLDL